MHIKSKQERCLHRLESNLMPFKYTKSFFNIFYENLRDYVQDNLEEIVEHLNYCNKDYNFDMGNFKSAEFFEIDKDFAKKFVGDYGLFPSTPILIFPPTVWDSLKRNLDNDDIFGLCLPARDLDSFNFSHAGLNLSQTGLILLKDQKKMKKNIELIEHELIHSCIEKFAPSYFRLSYFDHMSNLNFSNISHSIEANLIEESVASQKYVKKYYSSFKKYLRTYYLKPYINELVSIFEDNPIVSRLYTYINNRLRTDFDEFHSLLYSIPGNMFTPIVLSTGFLSKEKYSLRTDSPLDDIIIWSDMIHEPKIMQMTRKILKSKEYPL